MEPQRLAVGVGTKSGPLACVLDWPSRQYRRLKEGHGTCALHATMLDAWPTSRSAMFPKTSTGVYAPALRWKGARSLTCSCANSNDSWNDPARRRFSPASLPERSEEHTSELQSRGHLVCRLL